VQALRVMLAPTGWLDRTRYFARALRGRARTPQGLLIVGTPDDEPWHLTAHLADESRFARVPELEPTLVRWSPPAGAPAHLGVGIERLERARRDETLLVVSARAAPAPLLERLADARRTGAAIFALDQGDSELDELASEALSLPPDDFPASFDGAQHIFSLAVAEAAAEPAGAGRRPAASRPGLRSRLARLLDTVAGSP